MIKFVYTFEHHSLHNTKGFFKQICLHPTPTHIYSVESSYGNACCGHEEIPLVMFVLTQHKCQIKLPKNGDRKEPTPCFFDPDLEVFLHKQLHEQQTDALFYTTCMSSCMPQFLSQCQRACIIYAAPFTLMQATPQAYVTLNISTKTSTTPSP